jgi:hypothetical protein
MEINHDQSERLDQAGAAAEYLGFAIICCAILLGALSLALQMQGEMVAAEVGKTPNSRLVEFRH